MPDTTPILKTPIPLKSEADDVPAAMMAAFVDNEKASVPSVDTVAERDAEFNGTEISLVVVRNPPSIWMKSDDSTWWCVWSDTGLLTSGLVTPATGFTVDQQYGRARSGSVFLSAEFVWNGDPFWTNSTGDMSNKRLGSALGNFRPQFTTLGQYGVGGFNGGAYISGADGGIWIKDGIASYQFDTGTQFLVTFEYAERS